MNWFQIKAFVNKIKIDKMNIIKLSNGQSVVISNSPIVVGEGYCLNTNNNEVIYYNGNYGDETPSYIKMITYSWPKLAGTKELKTEETLRHELKYWTEHEPVNGMGSFARQTRMKSLNEQIDNL